MPIRKRHRWQTISHVKQICGDCGLAREPKSVDRYGYNFQDGWGYLGFPERENKQVPRKPYSKTYCDGDNK